MHSQKGITFIFVHTVCGYAAGKARPGLALAIKWALENSKLPDNLLTAFAGVDTEVVKKVWKNFHGFSPTSTQMDLLKTVNWFH